MQVELKSCPFCGGDAMDFYRRNTGATADWCGPVDHWVSCTGDCGAATCMHGTKDEAIAAWNRRAEQAAELAKYKALAETLAEALEPFAEEWDEREFLAQRHWSFYREASKAIAEYKEATNV